jgi:hypothetical protein
MTPNDLKKLANDYLLMTAMGHVLKRGPALPPAGFLSKPDS